MTEEDRARSEIGAGRRIWLDGAFVPWSEATVHVLSHSHARGSLVFDFMSVHETVDGVAIFRLDDHVARFRHSAELVGLPLQQDDQSLRAACCEAVRANPGAKVVKIQAYLPSVEIDVVPEDEHVAVAIAAFDPRADVLAHKRSPHRHRATVRIWLEKERRQRRPDIMHPHAKVAANYTSPMVAKWAARRRGYDEILLVDGEGFLAEGPTTNFFLVDTEGVLRTPPESSVLLGITRRSILEIAKHDGIPCDEAPLRAEDLFAAAEAFLTGTSAGVWPIESVDDRAIGEVAGVPCPGPVSQALQTRFRAIVSGADPDFSHWLVRVGG
jgi:branched-chain amino acid aminotransferase